MVPCLLIQNQALVKTVRFKNPKYVGDPVNAVKIFNEKEVDELVLLDITATFEKRKPNFNLIAHIASEAFMPLGYGGGVQDVSDMKQLFSLGIEKIVINSYAVENPSFIKQASQLFGSQSIVVSIDVRKSIFGKYRVFTHNGSKNTRLEPVSFAQKIEKMGAGEILLTSIDRDGTMQGYDLDLIKSVSQSVNIPVIVCGGAGKKEDFAKAITAGASAVAAGSMFVFCGKHRAVLISYCEVSE